MMEIAPGLLWTIAVLQLLIGVSFYYGRVTQIAWSRSDKIAAASVLLNATTFAAAVIGAVIAYQAFVQTKRQAEAADAANTIVQRPYVIVSELDIQKEMTKDSKTGEESFVGWTFQPILKNTGTTPTKGLRLAVTAEMYRPTRSPELESKLPNEPSDPDLLFSHGEPIRTVLGPQSSTKIATTPDSKLLMPNGFIRWLADGQARVHVSGAIRYFDRFVRTKEHVTKYCFRISAKGDGGADTTQISFSLCRFWNCVDDECDADKASYQKEAERLANSH